MIGSKRKQNDGEVRACSGDFAASPFKVSQLTLHCYTILHFNYDCISSAPDRRGVVCCILIDYWEEMKKAAERQFYH